MSIPIPYFLRYLVLTCFLSGNALAQELVPVPDWDKTLTDDWAGLRTKLSDNGLIVEANGTHISQYVFDGGLDFNGDGSDDDGHTFSAELDIKLDTEKAGLWPGGMVRLFTEVRTGESVVKRAGSAVNYDALLPAVPNRFDEEVIAVNEFALTQFFSESFGVFGGLIDSAYGDANDFTGDGRSNDFFLNSNFNANPVSVATTPDVALGGGVIYIHDKQYQGWAGAYNAESTAGLDPFEHDEGTTFFAEGSRTHTLYGKDGRQTFAVLYGIDKDRADLYVSNKLALESLITTQSLPTTSEDTWAIYYNAQQYIQGNSEKGWGVFIKAGLSDGDPNPVENFAAIGIGGKGILPNRSDDRFGLGVYHIDFSDKGILKTLDVENSYGFEAFYSFAITPWLQITPDIQVMNSPLPTVDNTTVVGGLRTKWTF